MVSKIIFFKEAIIKYFFLFIVSCLVISCNNNKSNSEKSEVPLDEVSYSNPEAYVMTSKHSSKEVDCINIENLTVSERLMILSLQGLVNRGTPCIYTYVNQDAWIKDLYKEKGYITSMKEYIDPWQLMQKYSAFLKSGVVCNSKDFQEVNLATNISGVEDRIILTSETKERFLELSHSTDILDLASLGLKSHSESFKWYRENIFPKQNHNMLSVSKGGIFMFDVYCDYLVEFKIPVFWLPGTNDVDYDIEYENEVRKLLKDTPVNIPILGFWPGADNDGKPVGYSEYEGVKLAGEYGKMTLVNTWVGNYSYHSGVDIHLKEFKQKASNEISYDASKKYVALVMTESGDAPCYFLYTGFFPRQWDDPKRGNVPISYGITPSIRYLAPALLENMYETQTSNDYFFCSISGAGYCYPFDGYGNKTSNQDRCLKHYFSELTSYNIKKMDVDRLAIYTHSGNVKWSQNDKRIVENYISVMPDLKTIVSGMHRTGYTGKESFEKLSNGVSVFHNVSFWSYEDFTWDDVSKDEIAAEHLVNEIKTYGADSPFITAMFYSWHYGPRRLCIVKEKLEKEGYVFVTLNQLDKLYNEYQKSSNLN